MYNHVLYIYIFKYVHSIKTLQRMFTRNGWMTKAGTPFLDGKMRSSKPGVKDDSVGATGANLIHFSCPWKWSTQLKSPRHWTPRPLQQPVRSVPWTPQFVDTKYQHQLTSKFTSKFTSTIRCRYHLKHGHIWHPKPPLGPTACPAGEALADGDIACVASGSSWSSWLPSSLRDVT